MTVKEAASRVGFDDEFYFSRIFRKYKGVPPSKLNSINPD
jgi:AraC-like DNA-binding protein